MTKPPEIFYTSGFIEDRPVLIQEIWNKMWRPIETALKDGRKLVLYCPNLHADDEYQIAWWQRGEWYYPGLELSTPEPTHWMPLPEPPND